MGFRAEALLATGGFNVSFGPIGDRKTNSNEELALSEEIRRLYGRDSIWFEPEAVVQHFVPAWRCTWRYLVSRSWVEGTSKADVRNNTLVDVLEEDRTYARTVLMTKIVQYARQGDWEAASRLVTCGAVTASAYLLRRALYRSRFTPSEVR
jgi:hypothetical protein